MCTSTHYLNKQYLWYYYTNVSVNSKKMSEVTNLIISFSIMEDEISRTLDLDLFFNNGRDFKVVSADYQADNDKKGQDRQRWYGGSKALETPLFIGAYNHLDLDGLIEHLKNIDWEEPENVQLIVKSQHSDKFKIIEFK